MLKVIPQTGELEYQDTLFGLPDPILTKIFSLDEPFAEVVTITPEMAKKWLGANIINRRLKQHVFDKIVLDIKNNWWELTGETIKIASTGRLLDGQNRLTAIVKAGVPVKTFVAFNLDEEVINILDRGAKRNVADNLLMKGYKNTATMAAIGRFIIGVTRSGLERHVLNNGAVTALSDPFLESFILQNIEAINEAATIGRECKKIISGSLAGGLFYLMSQKSNMKARYFFESLASGSGLDATDPIWLLRERLLLRKVNKDSPRTLSFDVVGSIIFAWNLYRAGKKVKVLRVPPMDEFPPIK